MQAPVDQALHLLLPTANLLPAQLVSTSTALLAQSKNVAPTLKAEEEIARTYACCHIACQRLSQKLSLDIGKVLPPCNPRVYKKLHAFLDGMLTARPVSQPSTPRSQRTTDLVSKTPTSTKSSLVQRSVALQKTPSGSRLNRAEGDKTSSASKDQRKRQAKHSRQEGLVPAQFSKLNQHLCQSMGLPDAIPHVYAGLRSILPDLDIEEPTQEQLETPSKRQRKASNKAEPGRNKTTKINISRDQAPLVVTALCFAVSRAARAVIADQDAAEELFTETVSLLREIDDDAVERMNTDKAVTSLTKLQMLTDDISKLTFWEGWSASLASLSSIQTMPDANLDDDEDFGLVHSRQSKTPFLRREKHGAPSQHDDTPGPSGLLPGLGTMFQPAVDWLGEERRAPYETWKQGILQEIAALEAA